MTPTGNEYTVSPTPGAAYTINVNMTYDVDMDVEWAEPKVQFDQFWASPLTLNDSVSGFGHAEFENATDVNEFDISADPKTTRLHPPLDFGEEFLVGMNIPVDVQSVTQDGTKGTNISGGVSFAKSGCEQTAQAFGLTPQTLWERAAKLPNTDTIWSTIFGTDCAPSDAFWSAQATTGSSKPKLKLVA